MTSEIETEPNNTAVYGARNDSLLTATFFAETLTVGSDYDDGVRIDQLFIVSFKKDSASTFMEGSLILTSFAYFLFQFSFHKIVKYLAAVLRL